MSKNIYSNCSFTTHTTNNIYIENLNINASPSQKKKEPATATDLATAIACFGGIAAYTCPELTTSISTAIAGACITTKLSLISFASVLLPIVAIGGGTGALVIASSLIIKQVYKNDTEVLTSSTTKKLNEDNTNLSEVIDLSNKDYKVIDDTLKEKKQLSNSIDNSLDIFNSLKKKQAIGIKRHS